MCQFLELFIYYKYYKNGLSEKMKPFRKRIKQPNEDQTNIVCVSRFHPTRVAEREDAS